MARKKVINERCPFNLECGKKECEWIGEEARCQYYYGNETPENHIDDQWDASSWDESLGNEENDGAENSTQADEGTKEKELKNIELYKIEPHPDNPRKELGDLEELVLSVKKNGVLQNLSVVPTEKEDEYLCLIGHRRLEAAKRAGITSLPCVVLYNLSLEEQVGIMLSENMQRNDLTVYEQAQGFQRMMDLGAPVSEIAGRTGFSETTIRRRVSLLSLDEEKFKKSQEKNPTLDDYMKLMEIEDEETRNKALEDIGTNNFENTVARAKEVQKKKQWHEEALSIFSSFATEVKEISGLKYVKNYNCYDKNPVKVPEDKDTRQYFYYLCSEAYIYLYTEDVETKKSEQSPEEVAKAEEQEKARREKEERLKTIKETEKRFASLRFEFMKNFRAGKTNADIICQFAVRSSLDEGFHCGGSQDMRTIYEILGLGEAPQDYSEAERRVIAVAKESPYLALAVMLFVGYYNDTYYSAYSEEYCGSDELDFLYDFLTALGYLESDEEKKFRKGTLFEGEEEE